MVGSYGPRAEEYEFLTPMEEAPKGMLARGSYNIKPNNNTSSNKCWNIHCILLS